MPQILVIAYGNPLRCDDGLAWHVAAELSQSDLPRDVEIITRHQLTPELALLVSQVSTVLFVDATRTGIPGELVTAPVIPQRQSSIFTHDFSPAGILGVSRELYGKSPQGTVISICGDCFDHGEILSATVKANLPKLVAYVKDLVQRSANFVSQP